MKPDQHKEVEEMEGKKNDRNRKLKPWMRSIGKSLSPTLAKNKSKLEYISERQPSPLEIAF